MHFTNSKATRRLGWRRLLVTGCLAGSLTGSVLAQQPTAPSIQLQNPVATQPTLSDVRLQVYNVPADLVGTVGAELQVQYHSNPQVQVTTDPATGQLMVMAPLAIHQQIGAGINTFMQRNQIPEGDRGINAATNDQRVYTLRNLSWRELEDAVQSLVGQRITVTTERNGELANLRLPSNGGLQDIMQVDRRENTVTILGSGATVAGWAQVIYSLDSGQADPANLTHVVPLSPAEPRKVKQAFRLVNATLQQSGNQATAEVDVSDGTATAMGTIDSLSSESGLFGDVEIEFIEEIDLVIIKGSKKDVQRTLEVIEKIKKQAIETQPEIEVYELQHANAEAVADLVNELYANIYEPRQGTVSITALGQPNALLMIGRKEVLASVKELVNSIDQPLAPQHQLKVIPLLHASAVDLETSIRDFFVQNPGANDEDRVGIGTRVKVLADYRTNSLVIQAAPREMLEVEKLIDQLDVEGATAENELKVFRLKNTLAEDLVTVIQEVIGGENLTGDDGSVTPPSGKLSIVTIDGGRVESGILAGVVITADPTVNAIVVRAPARSMGLIAKLIDELDQLPSAEAVIKVFQLKNGDAISLATTLQSLFGLPVTAGQNLNSGNLLNTLAQSALTTGGEGSLVQLQIAPDARTNSIIVSGAATDLEVLEVLLLRLDEDVLESRRMEVVWLRNANAQEVSDALNSHFQQLATSYGQLNQGQVQILSQQQIIERQVWVVPEITTNSLLVSAHPQYFEAALRLIERLDRRPPLVAIQVLIAEVQLDDQFEFGTEWGIQDGLLFDRQSATGGTLSSPVFNLGNALAPPLTGQNVAGQAISSFALGRSNSDNIGGLVLSASSEAVGILIRALQSANRLQVLSRPQITTLDSREASTLIGQQVPRVTNVSTATVGVPQQITTSDVPVGLGLAVLPRVNEDGLILMQVQVQNSSVGDADTGIPIGFGQNGEVIRSPIINTTEALTTVTAYSGQTVVFAGLISKNRASVRRQIPILGSLPLVGPAFRFDTETEQRRELLVVLTPRLIQTDEDYELLKQVESSRMSWCLADVLNVHGDVGLSGGNGLWGPARSQMIYPDIQPTVVEDRTQTHGDFYAPAGYEAPGNAGASVGEAAPMQGDATAQSAATSPYRTVNFARPAAPANQAGQPAVGGMRQ